MIEAALEDEQAEIAFRRYMHPLVEEVVDKYIAEHGLEALPRQELVSAGWAHFGMALKHYRKKAARMVEHENSVYYFATFLNWYIRQAIREYVNAREA